MSTVQWFIVVTFSLLLTASFARASELAACVPETPSPQGQVFQLLPQAREIRAKLGSASVYPQSGRSGDKRGQNLNPGPGQLPSGVAPMSDEKRESWERLIMMRVKNSSCADPPKPGRIADNEDDFEDPEDRPPRVARPGMGGAGGPGAGGAELKGVPQELANDPDFLTEVEEAKENHERVCNKKRIEEAKDEQIAAIRARKCQASADGPPGGQGAGPGDGDRGGPFERDIPTRGGDDPEPKEGGPERVHLDASARREVDEATDKWEAKCQAERAQDQKNAPARNGAPPMGAAGNMAGLGAMGLGGQSGIGGGVAAVMRPQIANYMAGYSAPYLFVGNSSQSSAASGFAGYPFGSGYYGYNLGISSIPFVQNGLGFRSIWGGSVYGVSGTSGRTF